MIRAAGRGTSISQFSTRWYSGDRPAVLDSAVFSRISGSSMGCLPFFRRYEGVPVERKLLHALVREVVADIVVLPFFREIDLPVGDRLQAFRIVGEFGTRNRHPLRSPRLQYLIERGDDIGTEAECI